MNNGRLANIQQLQTIQHHTNFVIYTKYKKHVFTFEMFEESGLFENVLAVLVYFVL